MKGLILAGGSATRLRPLTTVTNKHLLPLYNKPVIYYAIEKLVQAGIYKMMLVTSPEQVGNFVRLLGSGQDFISPITNKQIQITYGVQNEPNGIAYGLHIARDYVGSDDCTLYLGDNIFEDDIAAAIKNFKSGATIFIKKVADPERFGVVTFDAQGVVTDIVEKPKVAPSPFAVAGVYIFDNTAFEKVQTLEPSGRGEYEITDLNRLYLKEKKLRCVELNGHWFDIGTFDSLLRASNYMAEEHKKHVEKK